MIAPPFESVIKPHFELWSFANVVDDQLESQHFFQLKRIIHSKSPENEMFVTNIHLRVPIC